MKKVKVSKICTISNGFAFKSEMYVDEGARIIRITNVQKGHIVDNDAKFYPLEKITTLDNYKIFEEDILMSLTGNVGRVGLFPKELLPAYINQRVCRVKSNNENELTNRYLFHYFNSNVFENKAIQNSVGATQLNLSTTWLGNLEIPLPPLPQQKAIAAQLDKAQELIQYNEQLIEKYDELQQSLFLDMFGDPVVNEKGWEMEKFVKVCEKILGGGTPSKAKPEYYIGNIPWISPKDMKTSIITKGEDFINENALKNSSVKIIPKNSLLMVIRSGILKHTLPVAINVEELTINQDMKAFVPKRNITNVIFMKYFFHSISPLILSKVRAVTADNIKFDDIKDLDYILPPLSLQTEFASHIESIELQKEQAKEALAKSKDIFQGLLQEHFSN